MHSLGMQGEAATLLSAGGIGIVQFLAVLPAIAFIDRLGTHLSAFFTYSRAYIQLTSFSSRHVGRRPLLRGGSLTMAISHLTIALLVHRYGADWSTHTLAARIALVCVYTFTAAYGVSYGPIGWILPSEVFPLSARSKGVALSTASNWTNNCECWKL